MRRNEHTGTILVVLCLMACGRKAAAEKSAGDNPLLSDFVAWSVDHRAAAPEGDRKGSPLCHKGWCTRRIPLSGKNLTVLVGYDASDRTAYSYTAYLPRARCEDFGVGETEGRCRITQGPLQGFQISLAKEGPHTRVTLFTEAAAQRDPALVAERPR